MTRKEYVENAKQAILRRVRFHAPISFGGDIDKKVLFEKGVDLSKPIFKFERKLNVCLIRAFELAQREEDFNLVLPIENVEKKIEKQLKRLKNCVLYSHDEQLSFLESVNKLNINYASHSNYNVEYKDRFFKFNGEVLNPQYDNFALKQIGFFKDVLVEYREFVLNGNNVWIKLFNNSKNCQKIDSEFNISLKKGYYFFKKNEKCIEIKNLITGEKTFLNYVCKNASFCFSCVDGLENSLFCCVNIKIKTTLKPGEHRSMFFNFGQTNFKRKRLACFQDFFDLSRKLCCQIFNVRVKTKDARFDNLFNKILPQKIWINWINGQSNVLLEEKYLRYKKLFVKGDEDISIVPFKEIGLREIGLFNGVYYKKIVVMSASSSFLKIGKTYFNSLCKLSKKTLESSAPISLSFG